MARIKISDLSSIDADNLLNELSHIQTMSILGGTSKDFSQLVYFGIKSMEFILLAYAIDTLANLGKSLHG